MGRNPRLFFHGLFITCAFTVLGIHLVSQKSYDPSLGCKLHANAWLVKKHSCSVMMINCARRGIQGREQELLSSLADLDEQTLASLIVANCPALEIPPYILQFPNLGGIEIFNSTLVKWSKEAAIKETTYPQLSYFYLINVNMSTIPEGLMSYPWPGNDCEAVLIGTNLTSLPDQLHEYWRFGALAFDSSSLKEIPPVISKLPLKSLSLVNNKIEFIPDDFFKDKQYTFFSISRNPLRAFPSTGMEDTSTLTSLTFEHTNVSEVPRWIMEWHVHRQERNFVVESSAYGSPFCKQAPPDLDAITREYFRKACEIDRRSNAGWYSLEIALPQRVE